MARPSWRNGTPFAAQWHDGAAANGTENKRIINDMKNAMLLIVGIVLTLVLLVVPDRVFELGYYSNEFSNEMYNESLYIIVAMVTAAVAWGCALLFYYAINSVSFSRWYHWLAMLGAAAVVSPVAGCLYCGSVFGSLGYDFSAQLTSFGIVDCVVTILLFVAASFSVRWWSSNCRHTPIPE